MAFLINFSTKHIDITSPQTEVLIQDLTNYIREQEASKSGLSYPPIAEATGKQDLGGSVGVGITLELFSPWQLHFWEGNYIAKISGGNLVGGVAGDPIAYSSGVQVVIIQSAASTLVVTGSGITSQDKTDIANLVSTDMALVKSESYGLSEVTDNNNGTATIVYKDPTTGATRITAVVEIATGKRLSVVKS